MTISEINKCAEKAVKENTLRIYTPEKKHLFSKKTQLFFESVEKDPSKIFTDKYWKSQQQKVIEATKNAFKITPLPSIKQVIIDILNPLPDTLPPRNMIEITTYIVEEWDRLKEAKNKLEPIEIEKNIS